MKKLICFFIAVLLSLTQTDAQENVTDITSLQIGDYIQLGKYYEKPIIWRCADIDENGILILSDKALCRKPFDAASRRIPDLPPEFISSHNRYERDYTNCWKDSTIRSWLNSSAPAGEVTWLCGYPPAHKEPSVYFNAYADEKGFLANGNFTQSERNVIKEVTQKSLLDIKDSDLAVGGSSAEWRTIHGYTKEDLKDFVENQYDNICFEYVTDKVFLLDMKQLWNISQKNMLNGEDYYSVKLTQEAIDNDEENQYLISKGEKPAIHEKGWTDYWLRTPFGGSFSLHVQDNRAGGQGVFTSRPIAHGYYEVYDVGYAKENKGIRPAFYLNEENAQILSGSGTEEDPYVIDGKKKDGIIVCCNGWELTFDVPPMMEADRVLVPMRKIFETMGAEVTWEESTQTAKAVKGETTIEIQIDNPNIKINGMEKLIDTPARIVNDRTLVPLRVISESFGADVEWLDEQQRVEIRYCIY